MATLKRGSFLLHDLWVIAASVCLAVLLARSGLITEIVGSTEHFSLLGSFIAGLFFTSVFTTAPAIVALGEIAQTSPLVAVALVGGAGALLGDLLIFRFVRDRFSAHVAELVRHDRRGKRLHALFRLKLFRTVSLFVGALIIASPLPDELGVGLMGFSHVPTRWFLPLSFLFNALGIFVIGLVARAV
jgi:hypothetical protein